MNGESSAKQAEAGKPAEFQRFETAMKVILTVPKLSSENPVPCKGQDQRQEKND